MQPGSSLQKGFKTQLKQDKLPYQSFGLPHSKLLERSSTGIEPNAMSALGLGCVKTPGRLSAIEEVVRPSPFCGSRSQEPSTLTTN
jgi:hypothetical protein